MEYTKKSLAVAVAAALSAAVSIPAVNAEMPMTKHQANVTGTPEEAVSAWNTRLMKMPVTLHQREVLDDFNNSDSDRSGTLTEAEYKAFVEQRAQRMYNYSLYGDEKHGVDSKSARSRAHETGNNTLTNPTNTSVKSATAMAGDMAKEATDKGNMVKRDMVKKAAELKNPTMRSNLTAAAMLDIDKQYKAADRTKDGQLGFHEIYYYETFDRPSPFPTASESIPQRVSGHWENATVGEHGKVYHHAPFSAAKHRQSTEEGGFIAVDDNEDGLVSMFEASDFSMLTWTGAVRAFGEADKDNSATLTKEEFKNFQAAIAKSPKQADRPGEFPSGRMGSKSDS